MSGYEGKSNLEIAQEAERDLNTLSAATGTGNKSDSVLDSGIDEAAVNKFPGASVTVGSAASGAGNNRDIPPEEGGSIDDRGRVSKAGDFEGEEGGPEDKARRYAEENPGADDVRENVRVQGDANEGRDRV